MSASRSKMRASHVPTILTAAIDDSKYPELIDAIMNADVITELHDFGPHRTCTINTKYYTTLVQFCHQLHPKLSARNTDESIEAFVLYIDHPLDSLAEELAIWEKVRPTSADVVILVSKHSVPEDQKEAVLAWCIKNECELIELERDENATADSDLDYYEKFGIERLVEALQTHQWSNLNTISLDCGKHLSTVSPTPLNVPANTPNKTPPEYVDNDDDPYSGDQLDNLFQTLKSMKLEISSLSRTEKLNRAEEAVKTFWTAIGGDMNEFNDDSDGEFPPPVEPTSKSD